MKTASRKIAGDSLLFPIAIAGGLRPFAGGLFRGPPGRLPLHLGAARFRLGERAFRGGSELPLFWIGHPVISGLREPGVKGRAG